MPNSDLFDRAARLSVTVLASTLCERIDEWQSTILRITGDSTLKYEPLSDVHAAVLIAPALPGKVTKQQIKPQPYGDDGRHIRSAGTRKSLLTRPLLFDIRLRMRRQKYK